ncbi:AzlD domain-containing protein [Aurantimicrobium minutum]|uniref:AzlD domain-containing protein n=1 Tax=Aurantimicrobium minutum TaxID=708131 RepID=UPI00247713B7|nr:AzlD domain-containing protein [Aurantimicrobium minutum]MDH6422487.1 branched-subunit amino acid transport protein [Aurantimicrobium minutum]
MTLWLTVIIASVLSFVVKYTGYLIPQSMLEKPTFTRVTNLLTVAMLAALVAVQALGSGQAISVDARIPAVILAAILFSFRVPFIVVVAVAGIVAVVLRNLGWMA